MSRRTKIIIGVVIVLLIAVLAIVLLLRRVPEAPMVETTQTPTVNPVTGLPTSGTTLPETAPVTETELAPVPAPVAPAAEPRSDETASIKRLAAAFAERFGSYSNQSNFDNITDLKVFMTGRMQAWADQYVSEQTAQGTSTTYSGTTTRAIASTLSAYDEAGGSATVSVGTQRREAKADGSARVYYQDLELQFLKEDAQWKVDSANWK